MLINLKPNRCLRAKTLNLLIKSSRCFPQKGFFLNQFDFHFTDTALLFTSTQKFSVRRFNKGLVFLH